MWLSAGIALTLESLSTYLDKHAGRHTRYLSMLCTSTFVLDVRFLLNHIAPIGDLEAHLARHALIRD